MSKLSSKLYEIYELHSAGMATVEIAEAVNLPKKFIFEAIRIFDDENYSEGTTPYWNEFTIENYH